MPQYDYRCRSCGQTFSLFYKTYADFDAATPTCPHCAATTVSRLIQGVTLARPSRDLSRLSANEMMSVLDGGNSQEIGRLFDQVGQTAGVENMSDTYRETTEKLLAGKSVDQVEKGLREQTPADKPASSPAKPAKKKSKSAKSE